MIGEWLVNYFNKEANIYLLGLVHMSVILMLIWHLILILIFKHESINTLKTPLNNLMPGSIRISGLIIIIVSKRKLINDLISLIQSKTKLPNDLFTFNFYI